MRRNHHTPRPANTNQRIHIVDAARAEREGLSAQVIRNVALWNGAHPGFTNSDKARRAMQSVRLRQVAAAMHATMQAAA